jgi:DNA-binding NarL/FixJ family response regulator
MRAVIAEDEPLVREGIERRLTEGGFDVGGQAAGMPNTAAPIEQGTLM